MADMIYKDESNNVKGGNFYYNDKGTVKRPDDYFFNIGGEVIKFPKLDKCVLNLDALSWIRGNDIFNANTFLDPIGNTFEVYNNGSKLNTLAQKFQPTQQAINGSNKEFVTSQYRFLGIEATLFNKQFKLINGKKFGDGGKLTFHIKIKSQWQSSNSWWNPIVFKNSWDLRMEVGSNTVTDFNIYSNKCPNIAGKWTNGNITQNAQCATLVVDSVSGNITYYINGNYVTSVGCTGAWDPIDTVTLQNRRSPISQLGNIEYHSVRIWNDALTKDEVVAISKIDGCYIKQKVQPTTVAELRQACIDNKGNLQDIDTSRMSDFTNLFNTSPFQTWNNEDFNGIDQWNTSNVSNMNSAFSGCTKFNQPLNNWDTRRVTNMDYMFKDCSTFNQDISNWDTSYIRTYIDIFKNCPITEEHMPLEFRPPSLPALTDCLLNLDENTWARSDQSVYGASTGLDPETNKFKFQDYSTPVNTLAPKIDNTKTTVDNGDYFINSKDKFLGYGGRGFQLELLDKSFSTKSGQFTYHVCASIISNNNNFFLSRLVTGYSGGVYFRVFEDTKLYIGKDLSTFPTGIQFSEKLYNKVLGITMVGSGTNINVYINGVRRSSISLSSPIPASKIIRFIYEGQGNNGCPCKVFSVRLWDRVLSDKEIENMAKIENTWNSVPFLRSRVLSLDEDGNSIEDDKEQIETDQIESDK